MISGVISRGVLRDDLAAPHWYVRGNRFYPISNWMMRSSHASKWHGFTGSLRCFQVNPPLIHLDFLQILTLSALIAFTQAGLLGGYATSYAVNNLVGGYGLGHGGALLSAGPAIVAAPTFAKFAAPAVVAAPFIAKAAPAFVAAPAIAKVAPAIDYYVGSLITRNVWYHVIGPCLICPLSWITRFLIL